MKVYFDEEDSWENVSKNVEMARYSSDKAHYIVLNRQTYTVLAGLMKSALSIDTVATVEQRSKVTKWFGVPIAISEVLTFGVIDVV